MKTHFVERRSMDLNMRSGVDSFLGLLKRAQVGAAVPLKPGKLIIVVDYSASATQVDGMSVTWADR